MLANLMREYSKVKLLKIADEYSAPKDTKLEEFNIAFSKVNEENFDALCDIEYKNVLEDRLWLFPETNINFIVFLDKIFKPLDKIKNFIGEEAIYHLESFIANKALNYTTQNFFVIEKIVEKLNLTINRSLFEELALMLDYIKETRENRSFIFIDKKYGKDTLKEFLLDNKCSFAPVYGLGFNIILEK